MGEQPKKREILIGKPLGEAWDHMKLNLFPFEIDKWLILGFVTWLALLGSGVGGFNFNFRGVQSFHDSQSQDIMRVAQWIERHAALVLGAATGGSILLLVIIIVFSYLSSRGLFMYLDNIYHGTAEVRRPWQKTRAEAHSLFVWRAGINVAAFLLALLLTAAGIGLAWPAFRNGGSITGSAIIIFFMVLVSLPFFFILGLARWVLVTLIAPIMYLRSLTIREGWRELKHISGNHFGAFVLFWLLNVALRTGLGIVRVPLFCCCIGFIPVVAQAALQPLYYWIWAYPFFFLAQFSPEYAPPQPDIGSHPTMAVPVLPPQPPPPPFNRIATCPQCGQQHEIPRGEPGMYACVKCGGRFEVR